MLKKKQKIVILAIAVIVVVGIIVIVAAGRKEKGTTSTEGKKVESSAVGAEKVQDSQPNIETQIKYPKNGSLVENISEFVVPDETIEIGTELSDEYLKSIDYTVLEVDEEKKVAVIEMEVPDILAEIEHIVENAIQQNPTMEYEELLPIVNENLKECMKSEKISMKTEQLEVSIENVENTYKLVPSAELEDVLYKDLEEAYLEILLNGWEK